MVMNKIIKKYIINPSELKKSLYSNSIKIIDCRWFLNQPYKGQKDFDKSHIPNAIFYDLEKNSNKTSELPHMLPNKLQFQKFISKSDISKNKLIIIYDQNGFFCSSRMWFTFKLYNFKKIKILNGGFDQWIKKKYPINNIQTNINKKQKANETNNFLKLSKNMVVKKKYVKEKLTSIDKTIIVDARPKERFLGISPEPRKNLKSGNISGSINIPYNKLSNKDGKILGFFKLKELIEKKVQSKKTDEIICSCGSGVTACNIILILDILGYKNIKLYDGSWAEWGKK